MLSKLLRQILFKVVHLMFSLVEIFELFGKHLWIIWDCILRAENDNSDLSTLAINASSLSKKPSHLVVVDDNRQFLLEDFANFIIWSLVAGIPYISIYDYYGVLKNQEEKLFATVEKKKVGVPGCIKWSSKTALNGYSNGMRPNIITVNILTRADCRDKFADIVRSIAEKKTLCEYSGEELTAEELDVAIRSHYQNLPDPDLAIYEGRACLTKGLLPWHIRLTEFIRCPSTNGVRPSEFYSILSKYSKCNQRFGK